MSQAYKKISMSWFRLTSAFLIFFTIHLTSCTYLTKSLSERNDVQPMTEREYVFEKGKALFDGDQYEKSMPFFLKITRQRPSAADSYYENSLWSLSVAFERIGSPEKALLTLQELARTKQNVISLFRIRLAEMKNHFRVSNEYQALEVRKQIDALQPLSYYSIDDIYADLMATTLLNYDHLILEELEFIAETQKYFVYVMESKRAPLNERATDVLIGISDRTYALLSKENLNLEFRRKIAEALLDFLRRFDRYKIDDLNINLNTVSKFSRYSEKKQKLITEWLHQ